MDGSDKSTRQIEENYYGTVKELSIDNPLMKEVVELDHALRKLKSQCKSHGNEVSHAHRMMQSIPAEIDKEKGYGDKIKQDMAKRLPEAKGEAFSIVLEGKTIIERKEAGSLLKVLAHSLSKDSKNKNDVMEKPVGSYAGMNLVIRSTPYDPYSIAKVSACGTNFRYSADIHNESDPVGLCRSLHIQIYKGMEKMLEDSKQKIDMKEANLGEFSKLAQSSFPKQEELEVKGKRYNEVMDLLKKDNERKGPETQNPKNIPWTQLGRMDQEQIHEVVRTFLSSVSVEPEPEKKITTCTELQSAILEKYQVKLPPSVISTIENNVTTGKLDIQTAYVSVCSTIEKTKKTDFKWDLGKSGENRDAAFVKDSSVVSPGDVIIRKVQDVENERFDAYKMIDEKSSKFLGSEKEFTAIKDRVEQYVVCMAVRDKITDIIPAVERQVTPEEKENKVAEKDIGNGREISLDL
jgi:hypothetical protein